MVSSEMGKEGEKCEGGRRRLFTPTSLVGDHRGNYSMQHVNSNFDAVNERERAIEIGGEKEAVRVLIGSRPHLQAKFLCQN